ncbi:MAG: UDP-N-acetylmuramoyl-tripeptide--D-alanyl-D-alanine ligase [Firmicutes bacterium]|nr:UDP-N-acetylmuramoyl-tripeptide--D-alanyl-D-alanine ligase [Bacillota bacterium]
MLVSTLCQAVAGELLQGEPEARFCGVGTDSRQIQPGELFIALRGERFNGHAFVASALAAGAAGAVVSEQVEVAAEDRGKPLVRVADTRQALQQLAQYYRQLFNIPVIGVTGSTGKTTTKDMIAAVLSERWLTLKTAGNFNNEIGLPLTLLKLTSRHQAAVIEMAMRGRGEIAALCQIAQPTLGVITNIGHTHLELLGSQANIARAKAELLEALPPDGVAILNGDDFQVREISRYAPGRVFFYGLEQPAEIMARNIQLLGKDGSRFTVQIAGMTADVHLPIPGVHNVLNALAAVGVGYNLGLTLEEIASGLRKVRLSAMRLQIESGREGLTVINDAYNANPQSMKAALHTLVELADGRRTIAVLGSMFELGAYAGPGHREVGRLAAELGIDYLLTVGELAEQIAAAALEAGLPAERVEAVAKNEDAIVQLQRVLDPQDVVLVKGSRGMKMEEIVRALLA